MSWPPRAAAAALGLLALLYCVASNDAGFQLLSSATPHASPPLGNARPRAVHIDAAAAAASGGTGAVTVASAPAHDSEIPVYLPPLFALASSFVLGVASTGDGIVFLMLWSFAGHFGWLGHNYSFAKAVFYMSFIPLFCAPPIVWAARKELTSIVGYVADILTHPYLICALGQRPFGPLTKLAATR